MRDAAQKEVLLSHVTLTPYIVSDPDGTDPRIVFPVSTPAAFVMVETRVPGIYIVKARNRNGVPQATAAARAYASSHRELIARLYARVVAALDEG
ncbi:MAG: hypothetical protein AB7S26_06500 [Sandaracinaceae bacterium]